MELITNHHDPIPVPSPFGEGCLNPWDLQEMKKHSDSAKDYRFKSHARGPPSPFGESLSRKLGGQGEGKKTISYRNHQKL